MLIDVDLGGYEGEITVEVQLLFQSIGYRWAQNLSRFPSAEVDSFMRYYQEIPNIPIVVAENNQKITNPGE